MDKNDLQRTMADERELRKKFEVFLDQDEIINIVFFGPADRESEVATAHLVSEDVEDILSRNPARTFDTIIDNTAIGPEEQVPALLEARKVYLKLAKHRQAGKLAMVESGAFYKFFISVVARAGGMEFRQFESKKEAVKWLKKKKKKRFWQE